MLFRSNDILDLSKIEAGKMELHLEDFALGKLLGSIYNVMKVKADEKNIALTYDLQPEEDIYVNSDSKALSQILMNILSNAIKFTDRGFVSIRAKLIDSILTVDISDSGIGIPADKISFVFDAFEQAHGAKRDGTGLGLAITKRLVDLLDGTIVVSSELGRGSVFTVRVPMQRVSDTGVIANNTNISKYILPETEFNESLSKLSVLVVDDNEINLKLMKGIFNKLNVKCELADSGAAALNMLQVASYDIVFLDIQMPKMDGFQVLSRIRQSEKTQANHVVALTANAMEGCFTKYLAAGFDNFIIKPVQPGKLKEVISVYISRNKS